MATKGDPQGGVGLADKQDEKYDEPRMFKVIFHNDDFTPMDFVVSLLESVFHHQPADAVRIMMQIHTKGKGVAGVYSREVAETKAAQSVAMARAHEHPLEVTFESE